MLIVSTVAPRQQSLSHVYELSLGRSWRQLGLSGLVGRSGLAGLSGRFGLVGQGRKRRNDQKDEMDQDGLFGLFGRLVYLVYLVGLVCFVGLVIGSGEQERRKRWRPTYRRRFSISSSLKPNCRRMRNT
jgi:hypothetical protein